MSASELAQTRVKVAFEKMQVMLPKGAMAMHEGEWREWPEYSEYMNGGSNDAKKC